MGEIILFEPKMKSKKRLEAMMKGTLEEYSCDSCGEDIDVIDGNYPDRCPGCQRIITW